MLTIVRERVFSASGMGKKTFRFVGRCFLARWAFRAEESFYNLFFCRNGELSGRTHFRVVFFSSVRPRLLLLCTIVPSSSVLFFFGPAISSDKGSCIVLFSIHSLRFFRRISYVGF
jgi:hypothetical protein